MKIYKAFGRWRGSYVHFYNIKAESRIKAKELITKEFPNIELIMVILDPDQYKEV